MHDSYRESFGEAIVQRRTVLGMLQGQLADGAGLDQGTLSRIETGKMRCDVVRGRGIANALGLTLAELSARADAIDESKRPAAPAGAA